MLSLKEFVSTQEKLLDLLMLEALSDEQTKLAKKWAKDNTASREIENVHDGVFGGKDVDKVTIPLERAPRDHSSNPIHNTIKKHLEPHGYSMGDYDKGTVTDKHGRETSVGKALGRTKAEPSLMQKFNNDPSRQSTHAHSTGKSITISRHPLDVAGMSTGRKWDKTSCMRIGVNGTTDCDVGSNRKFIKSDMQHGTLAAYVHDNDDKQLDNPQSRVLLKRHDSVDYNDKPIFRPENRIYGDQNDDIKHTVNKWAEKHYPSKDDGIYIKHPSLYNDDGKTIHSSEQGKRKFNPKLLDHHIMAAGDLYDHHNDNNSGWDHEHRDLSDHIHEAMGNYRRSLDPLEAVEMDKHLHKELAEDYHEPEHSRDAHWSENYGIGTGENDSYNRRLAKHHFAYNTNIWSHHTDEIAKKFTDAHNGYFGDHKTAENTWDDLQLSVLNHGSDESKANVLLHHGTYGYENPEDTDFDARKHIVGKHTAKAWYEKMAGQHEGSDYVPAESHYGETHENMARHADDETFHNWLHSDKVKHDDDSYKAMARGASKSRQHKMLDDINFDNGEHNGDIKKKLSGMESGSYSKSILKRIAGNSAADKEDRRSAIYTLRHKNPYKTAPELTETKK